MTKSPKLKSLRIQGLYENKDVFLEFKDVTVIVGKNGMGKTTLLKIIYSLLRNARDESLLSLCKTAELRLTNNEPISFGYITDDKKSQIIEQLKKNLYHELIAASIDDFERDENKAKKISVMEQYIDNTIMINFKTALKENSDAVFFDTKTEKYLRNVLKSRYISTINISFNADNNVDIGNSVTTNLLDIGTDNEMDMLIRSPLSKYRERFVKQINLMLSDTEKSLVIKKNKYYIHDYKTDKKLKLNQLSSGERQLIFILATAANLGDSPSVFLMDEPEISLHLGWQEKILDALRNINDQMQIIVVTHSPAIVMNGYMDSYIDMADIVTENKSV